MHQFVLYCKSYRVDVKRVARLAHSVQRFNTDRVPFYVSAPAADLALFREYLQDTAVEIVSDEEIVAANPALDPNRLAAMPGSITQQIVKSEFWRLGLTETYLCLDSDCIFIRPFQKTEFVRPDGIPYTIIDEGRDILFPALAKGKVDILNNFQRESSEVQGAFDRAGRHYNFGPNCPVWDRRVWQSLEEGLLRPAGLSFVDLILKSPNEMRWYGEALLKYRAIPLFPSQPFFKMYHYAWQQRRDQRDGIGVDQLKRLYCGVVYQSAWEREMDWPSEGGDVLSRLARRARRALGRT
jgi:hypothetical protein